jgi:hypothetical protein
MDFWNNHQGRTISEQNSGATPIELTAIITDAFNGGLLRYLSPLDFTLSPRRQVGNNGIIATTALIPTP